MHKLALIYDFDGTLTEGCMHNYRLLPELGIDDKAFWSSINEEAKISGADTVCVWMRRLIEIASIKGVKMSKNFLLKCGAKVQLRPGLTGRNNWFSRINNIAQQNNLMVSHHIISCGLAEMIEGCKIAPEFKGSNGYNIYASRYHYNNCGKADWPACTVNYTTKTQFLFRISKGITDLGDDKAVNKHVDDELRDVPFGNMVFIGDGDTDIPCFSVLRKLGGFPIAILKNNGENMVTQLQDFVEGKRIEGFSHEKHFEMNGKLEQLVRRAAERISCGKRR